MLYHFLFCRLRQKCTKCNFSTGIASHVRYHIKTHTGEKPNLNEMKQTHLFCNHTVKPCSMLIQTYMLYPMQQVIYASLKNDRAFVHPKWRKATMLWGVQKVFQPNWNIEHTFPYSLYRDSKREKYICSAKVTQLHRVQCEKSCKCADYKKVIQLSCKPEKTFPFALERIHTWIII